ncbi:unnamed protein product [Thelazia callipaeda]|uniref:Reverse transcriptase domain-containing protein n=1 Tax=Thelazia callipaeda TaxID=103827 RepID=A0A0N5D7H1_THECL|nr:unnamed protein product [Thelazia callipaeda]
MGKQDPWFYKDYLSDLVALKSNGKTIVEKKIERRILQGDSLSPLLFVLHGPDVVANENVKIRVDTRVRTTIRIEADRPNIMIYDKKRRNVILIEVGITSKDRLTEVETEKKRNHDLLANKSMWIPRGRSSGDQQSRTERGARAARISEYDPAPESIMKKRRITSV